MTKVSIKSENITSFGGIYHVMDVFSKFGFERLSECLLVQKSPIFRIYPLTLPPHQITSLSLWFEGLSVEMMKTADDLFAYDC